MNKYNNKKIKIFACISKLSFILIKEELKMKFVIKKIKVS